LKGFNIAFYAEPHVNANGVNVGKGAVYEEILHQTNTGGVEKVGVFGYSHGGSATKQLTNAVGGGVNFVLTGYIDAILRGAISSENAYPNHSSRHWNNFQQNTGITGGLLNGSHIINAVPAYDNINDIDGQNVSHYTINGNLVVHAGANGIEKHPDVQADIISEVENLLSN